MKRVRGRIFSGIAAAVCLLGAALTVVHAAPQAGGQSTAQDKPLLSEQYFKNVQLLRGMQQHARLGLPAIAV